MLATIALLLGLVHQPATPTAKQIEAGAALYKKVGCFQCHVNEAQGGANGPRLGPNPIPLPRFIASTSVGMR